MRFQFAVMVLVSFSHVLQVYCGSYWDDLVAKRVGNRIYEYCETREGLLLFPGSEVMFKESCFKCTCKKEVGLSCKTPFGMSLFGYNGCLAVIDDCKLLLVDKYNQRLRCNSKIPTNQKVPKDQVREIAVNSIFG